MFFNLLLANFSFFSQLLMIKGLFSLILVTNAFTLKESLKYIKMIFYLILFYIR